MSDSLKSRILLFLHKQLCDNKIPQIKKGMAEDLEEFVLSELAMVESYKSANRMKHTEVELDEKDPE